MAKTGTTALQNALARNRGWLWEKGMHYPEDAGPRGRRLTEGNGSLLHEMLLGDDSPGLEALQPALKEADGRDVLFSSEHLFLARAERIGALAEVAEAAGVHLMAVVYVRDVAGHALSTYSQAVKRHGFTGSFADFVGGARSPYRLRLQPRLSALLEVLGPDRLLVQHYDSDRERLLERFLSAVGVEVGPGLERPQISANRSLTRREITWMRLLNAEFPNRPRVTNRISAALAALPPLGGPAATLPLSDVELVTRKFGGQVDWVNETFLDGRLRVDGGVEVVQSEESPEPTEAEEHLLAALAEVAARADSRPHRH